METGVEQALALQAWLYLRGGRLVRCLVELRVGRNVVLVCVCHRVETLRVGLVIHEGGGGLGDQRRVRGVL